MRVLILHLLFFVTGATGLVYEVIWTRMLGHVVGNTTQAIGLVLAAFMAGLALGSLLLGKWADRRSDPLKIYAGLELGIAACALAIPGSFDLLVRGYVALHHSFSGQAELIGSLRFVIAFVVLVIPTFLMGATLPVLARYALRQKANIGQRLGTLYAINTLGAMVGAALSGFVLMRIFGISGAGHVAIGLNIAVAVVAMVLHRASDPIPPVVPMAPVEPVEPVAPETATADDVQPSGQSGKTDESHPRYVWLFGLSGMVALALEVLWTKSLSFFLGNTTQAFSTMLSTFLFGLAVGAFVISRKVDGLKNPVRAMGSCLIGIGGAGLLTLPLFGAVMNRIGMPDTVGGFLVAALVMLPATLFMGAMLPLTARVYAGYGPGVGGRVGQMYAINTGGAILGSLLAAFATIPLFGIHGSVLVLCGLSILSGIMVLVRQRQKPIATLLQGGAALALLVFFVVTANERFFSVLNYTFRDGFKDEVVSHYYNETSSGIVEVTEEQAGFVSYKIDGQNQAKTSTMGMRVHNLLSQLGLLLHPHPKDVLMVALGGGMTAGGVVPFEPLYRFDSVDVVEISPAIVEVAAFFKKYNHDILNYPKLTVFVEDGRNFMLTSQKKYDVIVTGVIHPKHNAGNAGMYGRNYYELVKTHLKPGGVVVQWTPINGVRESEFKSILGSFVDAFPHASLWFAQNFGGFARGNNNLMVVGSPDPLTINFTNIAKKMSHPSVGRAMAAYGVEGPLELLDTFVTDADGIRAYVGDAPVYYDDHNPLEFLPQEEHAPDVLRSLFAAREPIGDRLTGAPTQIRQRLKKRYAMSDLLLRADLAADQRQFQRALSLYKTAMNRYGGGAEVAQARHQIVFLGHTWVGNRQRDFDNDPGNPRRCRLLGEAHLAVGELTQAEAVLGRCLALSAEVDTYLSLGQTHYTMNKFDKAIQTWSNALKIDPDRHEPYFNMGLAAERKGDYAQAIEYYAEAEKRAPEQVTLLLRYGKVLLKQRMMARAVEMAQRIHALEPDEPWAAHVTQQVAELEKQRAAQSAR